MILRRLNCFTEVTGFRFVRDFFAAGNASFKLGNQIEYCNQHDQPPSDQRERGRGNLTIVILQSCNYSNKSYNKGNGSKKHGGAPAVMDKNISEYVYEILKQVATYNCGSISSEIIWLIGKATISKQFHPEEHPALARCLL